MRLLSLCALLLTLVLGGRADTELPDTLYSSVLTPEGSPYHIRGYCVVAANEVVEVQPGVEVIFHPTSQVNVWLWVNGILHVEGTPENPVDFRVSDEAAAEGLRWNGIYIQQAYVDSSAVDEVRDRRPSVIRWARLRDANIGITGLILAGSAEVDLEYNLIVEHTIMRDCLNGVYINRPSRALVRHNIFDRSLQADLLSAYADPDVYNNLFVAGPGRTSAVRIFQFDGGGLPNLHHNCFSSGYPSADSLLVTYPQAGPQFYSPVDPTSFRADPMLQDSTDYWPDPLTSPLVDTGDPLLTDPDGSVSDIGLRHVQPEAAPAALGSHPAELRWVTGFDFQVGLEVVGYPIPQLELLEAPPGFEARLVARTRLELAWDAVHQGDGQFPLRLQVSNLVDGELRSDTLETVLNFQLNSVPRRVEFTPCPSGDCTGEDPLDLLFTEYFPLDTLVITLTLEDFEVDSFGVEDRLTVRLRRDGLLLFDGTTRSGERITLSDVLDTTRVDYLLSYGDGLVDETLRLRVQPRYQKVEGTLAGVLDADLGPVYITGPVRVREQTSLAIPAGTRLIVGEGWTHQEPVFEIEGSVEVAGSLLNPVECFSLVPWSDEPDQMQDPRPTLFRLGLQSGTSSFAWMTVNGFGDGIRFEYSPGTQQVRDCAFINTRNGVVAVGTRLDVRNCLFSNPADSAQFGSYGVYVADSPLTRVRNNLFLNSITGVGFVDSEGLVANNSFHSEYTLDGNNFQRWPSSRLLGAARVLVINSGVDVRNNLFHFKTQLTAGFGGIALERLLTAHQRGVWIDGDSRVTMDYNWFDIPDARTWTDTLTNEIQEFGEFLAVNTPQDLLSNQSNGFGDSRFTQESGFLLSVDSPLVNGGDPASQWNDSNGSRNDIGFQGGPLGRNLGGAGEAGGGDTGLEELPTGLVLRSAWPNPFNPATTIELAVAHEGPVDLGIYNLRGARVATLASSVLGRGLHTFRFDGSALASGPYYAHVSGPAGQHTLRLLLIK